MKKIKLFFLIAFLISISTLVSGCVTVKTNSGGSSNTSAVNGGVFKTISKGMVWQQKVLIPSTSGKPGNIAALDVASMVMDPSDNKAIYFGSVGQGLYYTYDAGDGWKSFKPLGQGTIRSIAVDYNLKCTIYASIGNKLFKTLDCGRTWQTVYYDNEVTATVDAIAVDQYNSSLVYIGISRGDIIKSSDGGTSWQTLNRTKSKIKKIVIDPNDTKVIFIAMNDSGIYRTIDGGNTWTQIKDSLNKLKIGVKMNNLILVKDEPANIYVATENGLARSTDRGETWENISILPPDNKAKINDMAVNPKNTKEIYYVSDTTFFSSIDGGTNWSTIKLPTSRAGTLLLLDPKEPNTIYLGVKALGK
jgi:photosystem II stability/assembly factor-like uncharacterized protein